MKKPTIPPNFPKLFQDIEKGRFSEILSKVTGPLVRGRYIHWDRLRYRTPPEGLTHEEWWLGLKWHRMPTAKAIPLRDIAGQNFQYSRPDVVLKSLHEIDMGAGGFIQMPSEITNRETRDRYYYSSLVEEAITSSQLEGSATTREVAKEMLRTRRPPQDRSERMILNNFLTMKRISDLKHDALTPELVKELHRIITEQSLDDPSATGRFRTSDEKIGVWTQENLLLHRPPPASELDGRMVAMCDFANGRTPDSFVHPVVRAIILHFWLAYDHPFCDGNGRVARALFYWCMLHHGFWLFEFLTISSILRKAPAQYALSFLYTESDDNDLTYFIVYQLRVIGRAISGLHEYIRRKAKQIQAMEAELRGVAVLNHRQKALVSNALRHPERRYTIESHKNSHGVVHETARADLFNLQDRALLEATKVGRRWFFTPVANLHRRLAKLD